MEEKNYLQEFDVKDPWFIQKNSAVQSLNQLSDRIRENKDWINSKIYFTFSLIVAIFMVIFAEAFNWIIVLALVNILMLILIFPAREYYHRRKELAECKMGIEKKFKELGMELKN